MSGRICIICGRVHEHRVSCKDEADTVIADLEKRLRAAEDDALRAEMKWSECNERLREAEARAVRAEALAAQTKAAADGIITDVKQAIRPQRGNRIPTSKDRRIEALESVLREAREWLGQGDPGPEVFARIDAALGEGDADS